MKSIIIGGCNNRFQVKIQMGQEGSQSDGYGRMAFGFEMAREVRGRGGIGIGFVKKQSFKVTPGGSHGYEVLTRSFS